MSATRFPEKWIHVSFVLMTVPMILGLHSFMSSAQLILLSTFCFLLCGYFHMIFHQKLSTCYTVQVEVLTSIRDMLSEKLNTKKVIIMENTEESDDDI